jgi:hypothetical protein
MTIEGALLNARSVAMGASTLADTGLRSLPATHPEVAWGEPQPRDVASDAMPRRPTLLRGGSMGLHHRALQNLPAPRSRLLPPDAHSKDSQLAETLRECFSLFHCFLNGGRLTLSSLRQIAGAALGQSDKLDAAILAAREINNRPPLRDAILSADGDITRDSLRAAAQALQGNSSPNTFSQDPFHGQDNAHVVKALQGLFEQLRDPTKDRTFFFEKHHYVEIAGLRTLMGDPDAVDAQARPILDPSTGLPGKQYSEFCVYTAKNILERPGLVRSLESASGTPMFGLAHQKGCISNVGLERWLAQDKVHKAR